MSGELHRSLLTQTTGLPRRRPQQVSVRDQRCHELLSVGPELEAADDPPRRADGKLVDWPAFADPAYTLFAAGMFFNFWGAYFGFYYLAAYARSTAAGVALAASFTPDAVSPGAVSPADLRSDGEASAEYRAHLVTVMAKRAVQACQ